MLTLSLQEKQVIRDRLSVCNNSLTKLDKEINIAQSEVKSSQCKIKETQEQIYILLSGIRKIYENLNGVIVLSLKDTRITTEQLLEDINQILRLLEELCKDCAPTQTQTQLLCNGAAIYTDSGNDLHIKSINLTLYFVSYHHRMVHISNSTTELTKAEGK